MKHTGVANKHEDLIIIIIIPISRLPSCTIRAHAMLAGVRERKFLCMVSSKALKTLKVYSIIIDMSVGLTSNTAARRSGRTLQPSASSLSAKSAEQHCYASPEVTSYKSYHGNTGALRFQTAFALKCECYSVTPGRL